VDLPLCFFPYHHSFGYSLSHQSSYFRWSTQGTVSPPTMLKTMGRATTKKPTRHHPLCIPLRKCWLCRHRCSKPCSRPWSTCMHNPKRHRRRGIGCEIFSALPSTFSYAVEPMDADDWLKSVEKKLQVVRCNNREKVLLASHQFLVPQATGGMLTWKPMS
jgi:hypothetical protein